MEENFAQWDEEIAAFARADELQAPPRNPLLFLGSSTVRLWENIEEDFAEFAALNRGFGGSQISDVLHFLPQVALCYEPRAIVFYGGGNDLAAGKTPSRVLADFREFARRVRAVFPECELFVLSVKPEPARMEQWPDARRVNEMLQNEVRTLARSVYIDVATPLLNENSQSRAEFFEEDMLHLNARGCALWTEIVRPMIAKTLSNAPRVLAGAKLEP